MKKTIFFLVAFLVFQTSKAQTIASEPIIDQNSSIYNSAGVEVKPEFPGGMSEFYHFIGKNYKVPDVAGLKGKIMVSFVIEKDGTLTEIKVLKDIGHGTGIEAIRVLSKCPRWTPAMQNGQNVRCFYTLPINIETSK
jgi:protein TonB